MSHQMLSRPARLMTIADAAEVLAVSPRTVRRLIDDGALQAVRIRGQIRIHPADLDRYLQLSGARGSICSNTTLHDK